jgi:hypothetical protein
MMTQILTSFLGNDFLDLLRGNYHVVSRHGSSAEAAAQEGIQA